MKRRFCLAIVLFSVLSTSSCTASMTPEKTELLTSTPWMTSAAASAAAVTPKSTPTPDITPISTASPSVSNDGIATRPPIKADSLKISPSIIDEAASVETPESTAMPDFIDGSCVIKKDSFIYYQNGDAICRRNIADKTETILRQTNGGIQEMFFGYDNELYYTVNKYNDERELVYLLYRYNESGDIPLLGETEDARNYFYIIGISDKAIYLVWSTYMDATKSHIYEICRYDVYTKNIELLFYFSREDNIYIEDFRDGLLYFYYNRCYYAINIQTKKISMIFDGRSIGYRYIRENFSSLIFSGIIENAGTTTYFEYSCATGSMDKYVIRKTFKDFAYLYHEGTFLYIVECDEIDNGIIKNVVIYKYDISSSKLIGKKSIDGVVGDYDVYDGKLYFYVDKKVDEYSRTNKRLVSYDFHNGSLKQVAKFNEHWGPEYLDSTDTVDYISIAGGYIWGYQSEEDEIFNSLYCFSVPVPK